MIKAIVFDAYGTLYDVQSVADVTDAAFPGHGDYITQVWRLKQLEYSWLCSMMGRYRDFWSLTRDSLAYTLGTLGLEPDGKLFDAVAASYNALRPYPDAQETLVSLSGYRLAILSNGSPDMLSALVKSSALDRYLDRVISVDARRAFKPDPRTYGLVEEELGVAPGDVLFVSSNGFDVSGAKSFGFRVARIARVAPEALRTELESTPTIGPQAMFRALRTQQETCGPGPDVVIASLSELPDVLLALANAPTGLRAPETE